jgi:DNA-binding CsgD family transcriptional regulator
MGAGEAGEPGSTTVVPKRAVSIPPTGRFARRTLESRGQMLRQTGALGDEPGVLALIAAAMCGVTDCSRSAVFVLDPGRPVLRGSAAHGFPPERVAALEAELRDVPLAAAALDAGAPVRCRDEAERCLPRSWVDELRLTDPVFVPLSSGPDPVAWVLLDGADVPDEAWPDARRKAAAYASVAGSTLRAHAPPEQSQSSAATTAEAAPEPNRPTAVLEPDDAGPVVEFRRPEPVDEPDRPRLTEQELKVVRLVAEGLTNPEIGARLGLSRHTVKEYLSHAMRKLEATNRVEAVRRAGTLGVLDGGEVRERELGEHAAPPATDGEGEPPVESSDLKVPPVKIGRPGDPAEP